MRTLVLGGFLLLSAGAGRGAYEKPTIPAPKPGADAGFEATVVAALHRFAAEGEPRHVKVILEKYPKLVDARQTFPSDRKPYGNDDYAALHHAVDNGQSEVVAYLLTQGADVNRTVGSDWTPLHMAAAQGDLKVAKLLVKAGAKIDAKTATVPEGFQVSPSPAAPNVKPQKSPAVPARTPLELARERKHAAVVGYLESLAPAQKAESKDAKPVDDPNEAIRKQLQAIPIPAKTPFDGDERKKADYLRSYRDGHFWAQGNHLWCPTNPSANNLHAIRGWIEGWQAGVKAGGHADLPAKYGPYLMWNPAARADEKVPQPKSPEK